MKQKTSKIFVLFAIIVLSISFVSAGLFSDAWNRITGKYIDEGCIDDGTSVYSGGVYYYDRCSSDSVLQKPFCSEFGVSFSSYVCEGGCVDGACVESSGTYTRYYFDEDGDDYGTEDSKYLYAPEGNYRTTKTGDCDDSDPNVRPGKADICDGIDNNCYGGIDEDCCTEGLRKGKVGQQIGERCDPVNIIDLTGGVYPPCCSGNCVRPDGTTCVNHNDCICAEATVESDAAYVEEEWIGDVETIPQTTPISSSCLGTDTSCENDTATGTCTDCVAMGTINSCGANRAYVKGYKCQNNACVTYTISDTACPSKQYVCSGDVLSTYKWGARRLNRCQEGVCVLGPFAYMDSLTYDWDWTGGKDCSTPEPESRCSRGNVQERTHKGKSCTDGESRCNDAGWNSWETVETCGYGCVKKDGVATCKECKVVGADCSINSQCCSSEPCKMFSCGYQANGEGCLTDGDCESGLKCMAPFTCKPCVEEGVAYLVILEPNVNDCCNGYRVSATFWGIPTEHKCI